MAFCGIPWTSQNLLETDCKRREKLEKINEVQTPECSQNQSIDKKIHGTSSF